MEVVLCMLRDNITSFVEKQLIPQGFEGLSGTMTLPNKRITPSSRSLIDMIMTTNPDKSMM